MQDTGNYVSVEISEVELKSGLFGFTAFWNLKQKLTFIIAMVFNAHSENVLFFPDFFFIKSY